MTALFERADLIELGAAANRRRHALNPDGVVTYIVERNINYTNVCITACRFCAFFRNPGDTDEGYVLSREEMGQKIRETVDAGGVQILLQGGLNPELPLELVRGAVPPPQGDLSRSSCTRSRPRRSCTCAGWSRCRSRRCCSAWSRPGSTRCPAAAPRSSSTACARASPSSSAPSSEWLEVMRVGHRLGLRSSSTMMFACGETLPERAEHLLKMRDLQDETGGFTAFICWPFQPGNTRLPGGDGSAHAYLRTLATGAAGARQHAAPAGLVADHGCRPWGRRRCTSAPTTSAQVMFEENVVSAAGTVFKMDVAGIERHVRAAGFKPVRRDMRYGGLSRTAGSS